MRIKMNAMEVRALCIKNNWFTNGDNTQYTKLFERVGDGAEIDEIAAIIWICSANADKDDIARQLSKTVDKERVQLVRAMEMLARAVNDEDVFMYWLISGVADGDINENTADEDLEYYTEDRRFSELMDTFLKLMSRANNSGGLYADGIVSNDAE